MEKIAKILNNKYTLLSMAVLGFLGWFFNFTQATVILFGLCCMLIFIFCDDPKSVVAIVISVPFYLRGFNDTSFYVFYGVAIGLFIAGSVVFLVKQLAYKKREVTKGRMFWAFVIFTIVSTLGGIFYHFNIVTSLLVCLICLLIYFFYFLCLNFTENLKKFLLLYFISISILVYMQIMVMHLQTGDFVNSFISKSIKWVGAQHINTCSAYFVVGMLSLFWLGYENKKYDYLFCLGGVVFLVGIFLTYGRISTVVGGIFALIAIIVIFIKSKNKKYFYIAFSVVAVVLAGYLIFFWSKFISLIRYYIELGFSGNGRQELWPWCLDRFKREPFFGIGFVTYGDPVPTIGSSNVVLAHNTFLQYLTSTGIIGTLFMLYFYYQKYKIHFNGFKNFDVFALLMTLCLEGIGMFDQNITMDFFVIIICTAFIVVAEIANKQKSNKEQTQPDKENEKVEIQTEIEQ